MAILQADVREQPHTGDWEKGLSGKDGYPVFALILVFILIAMTAVASGRIDTTAGMPYVLGATIGPALLFWGIAYAVTIRHASLAWQIGSFAGVTLVALLYFAGVMGTASTAAKHDVAMLAEVRIDPEGMAILPADPDRGPVSRVFIAHYTELNAILRDRRALLKSSGLGSIVDPQALSKTPSLLRDCPRFGRAKTSSDAAVARLDALITALPGKLERAGIEPAMRQQLLAGMSRGVSGSQLKIRAAGARINALFEEAEALCTVLARRRWTPRGQSFVFSSIPDMQEYDRHVILFNGLILEDQAADTDMRRAAERDRTRIRQAMD